MLIAWDLVTRAATNDNYTKVYKTRKELSPIDNDLPILNKALVDYTADYSYQSRTGCKSLAD